jgi:hypothetical protein
MAKLIITISHYITVNEPRRSGGIVAWPTADHHMGDEQSTAMSLATTRAQCLVVSNGLFGRTIYFRLRVYNAETAPCIVKGLHTFDSMLEKDASDRQRINCNRRVCLPAVGWTAPCVVMSRLDRQPFWRKPRLYRFLRWEMLREGVYKN